VIPEHIQNRKGARNTASVPPTVLGLLNHGHIETVNLCEWLVVNYHPLVVDHSKILPN
jgi:hypothetical protein